MRIHLISSRNVKKTICNCFFLVMFFAGFSQPRNKSLYKLDYLSLNDSIFKYEHNSITLNLYLDIYKKKAFQENNIERKCIYYKNFVFFRPESMRLTLIDSAFYYAYKTKDKTLIGSTYLTQGVVHNTHKNYQKTLESYLKAYDYIIGTNDEYLLNRTKNHIAVIKNYLGHYDEAAKLFSESIDYFAKDLTQYNNQRGYLNSMRGLAWSQIKTGNYDKATVTIDKALALANTTKVSELDEKYLQLRQGINNFYFKEYDKSIQIIKKSLPAVYKNDDFAWGVIGEHYIGKSLWNQGFKKEALSYFVKADSIFQLKNYSHPDLREGYELLIDYYQSQNDTENQLKYINQLVGVDQYLTDNYKSLSKKIHKEYSTKVLEQTKKDLEQTLSTQKYTNRLIYVLSILVVIFLLFLLYRNYLKKTSQPVITESFPQQEPTEIKKQKQSTLKPDVRENILKRLSAFEAEKEFLQKGITQTILAKKLDTNTTYLSEVINTHKGKNFSKYINDLRIQYLIKELKENENYRNFSFDQLAEIAGYENQSRFSDAFLIVTGKRPSEFIDELKTSKS